jgi:transposase
MARALKRDQFFAWCAQLSSRGVQVNKVCVAVARELASFVWAIAQQTAPTAAVH